MPTDFSVEWNLFNAVATTLQEHVSDTQDDAVRALALIYAETIEDDVSELHRLGPKLLDCLEALNLSARARASVAQKLGRHSGKVETTNATGSLDELAGRRARKNGTA